MKRALSVLVVLALLISSARAGLPEIKDLEAGEEITIEVTYSEPQISTIQYLFTPGSVIVREEGQLLGRMRVTPEEAELVDRHLNLIRRSREALRHELGAPHYKIVFHPKKGKNRIWTYHVAQIRESAEPSLSLVQLRQRIERAGNQG